MGEGSYFGEVSPLVECKRSATVIARSYGTYGELSKEALKTFLANFPLIRAYMWEHIMSTYDDDLKLFLGASLSKIDYFRKLSKQNPQIITHLGFCMEARIQDSGQHLFEEKKEYGLGELYIIYDGLVEIFFKLECGTEFNIETLSKGSIINPHLFVSNKMLPISARVISQTMYYTLASDKFS